MADKFRLLVEGKDDEHVLYRLRDHHNVPTTFTVNDKKGIDNLLETLEVELIGGGLERLGVIVDADTNFASRWQSLRGTFAQAGCPLPDNADPLGTIVEVSGRTLTRVGVWIMPDNDSVGMLEDFVRSLVPPGDVLMAYAEECVDEVIVRDRRFPLSYRSKALIHTWLSWQEDPGTPLGLAIKNSRMNPDLPGVLPLINWLRRLFALDGAV